MSERVSERVSESGAKIQTFILQNIFNFQILTIMIGTEVVEELSLCNYSSKNKNFVINHMFYNDN